MLYSSTADLLYVICPRIYKIDGATFVNKTNFRRIIPTDCFAKLLYKNCNYLLLSP